MIAYRGPRAADPGTLALDVAQYVLSVGQSSRLVRELVYRQESAVSVSVDWSWRFDPGAFVIGLELKPGADPRAAEASLYQQLARLCDEGITEVELERAKNNLSAHLLRELATNNGRAHALGNYEVMLGGWREGLALAARYESITAREVQNAAQQYLTPHRRSVVTLVPEPQATSEAA
jgi:predicted Zn-dependent peptidase